ncbi:MAG TPA: MBL fold metallo-hydrolase [Solirubrobacterales bacterium]
MRLIDVRHLGRERVIGCWVLDGVLIDPGPTSSLENLLEALGGETPRALLLTHIHLDHAGASGTIVRRWPELPVYVHERGARHLADPAKLLASASRLYGDQMEHLWGEVAPVPERNLRPLSGGEELLGFEVAYTPGHASHHVSYLHTDSGRAFVGDTAAVRIPPSDFVLPPTPPPDIDLELWNRSIDRILEWEPTSLGLTHFGASRTRARTSGLSESACASRLSLRASSPRKNSSGSSGSGQCGPRTRRPSRRCSRRCRRSSSGPGSSAICARSRRLDLAGSAGGCGAAQAGIASSKLIGMLSPKALCSYGGSGA